MEIDWKKLRELADQLGAPAYGGGRAYQEDLESVEQAIDILAARKDHAAILRLWNLFTAVIARDSISVHASLRRLTEQAIDAAGKLGDIRAQAHLLGANGHNLHRQGFHQRALEDFFHSYQLYEQAGEPFEALESYFMMAACRRALGNMADARKILEWIFAMVPPGDPWLGNPLDVLGWLQRDEGRLDEAEAIFQQALALHRTSTDSDTLVAGTLADLGEILGLHGRNEEARACFEESLELIRKYQGQFDRQEARTEMKFAELLIRERKYAQALELLDHADDLIAYGTYMDQLWKVELLRAMIKFRQGNIRGALRRIRSAKAIYGELGLPPKEFIQHTVNRLRLGTGLFVRKRK